MTAPTVRPVISSCCVMQNASTLTSNTTNHGSVRGLSRMLPTTIGSVRLVNGTTVGAR